MPHVLCDFLGVAEHHARHPLVASVPCVFQSDVVVSFLDDEHELVFDDILHDVVSPVDGFLARVFVEQTFVALVYFVCIDAVYVHGFYR